MQEECGFDQIANLILVRLWRFAVVINIRLDSTREEGEGKAQDI